MTLGQVIRGARLGYGWCEAVGAFVRVSRAGPSRSLVEVCPADQLPKSVGKGEHYIWWADGENGAGTGRLVRRLIAGELRRVQTRRLIVAEVPDDWPGNRAEADR